MYDKLSKITSNIQFNLNNFNLKHSIRLSGYNETTKKVHCFHNEIEYRGKHGEVNINVNINFIPQLIIEEKNKEWDKKETALLNYNNIHEFKRSLKKVYRWFNDEEYKNLFAYEGNRLILNAEFKGLHENARLSERGLITFVPVIINSDRLYEGVQMIVNNPESYELFTISKFEAFMELMLNFDLYNNSLNLLSYIGKPDLGKYSYNMNNKQHSNDSTSYSHRSINLNEKFKLDL